MNRKAIGALMVLCLNRELPNDHWLFKESELFMLDLTGFDEYDNGFEKLEKEVTFNQEVFNILSHSFVE
ncbi:MAG: hypothetical protein EHM45_19310 [Desulfobacteraceae bacterium]|nr:MAG: hypothetical protein EHM45_19310 [Desulfobacteraceae bacterium]